jgi:DnaJ-class molecular chaperone
MESEQKHKIREVKNRTSIYCLSGTCPKCSRIVDGRGIHDIVIYSVYEGTELQDCDNCNGQGTIETECPECSGTGVIFEDCVHCEGKGKVPDECGDKKLIGEEVELISKQEGEQE